MSEQKLSTEFASHGFNFNQISRDGDIAVYAKSMAGMSSVSYETVIVQHHKATEMFGKHVPAREGYPSSELWGAKGWTYPDLDSAISKANQLIEEAA